jgi:hypothetical protein
MKKNNAIKAVEANEQFPLSSEEISLLAELGFMAATAGYVVPAIRIFQGLLVLRAEHSFPYVGLAVARLYVGAFADAVRILRDNASAAIYGRKEIELYLGLAHYLADQPAEASRVLIPLLERGELDTDQQPLAEAVLAQIEGRGQACDWPSPARVVDIQEFSSSSH